MKNFTANKVLLVAVYLGLYLVTSGITYAVFGGKSPTTTGPQDVSLSTTPGQRAKFKVDPSVPRDQVCPLDGVMYTKKEADVYDKRRPLAIMVENSEDARPQSSLSRADIVYEALAEGWITRFMGVFYCNTPFENMPVAPVRSARTYFIDWVSEYDALYNHVGGANRLGENSIRTDPRADAIGQINKYGIKDMDEFGIGFPDCYRNPDRLTRPVATEHQMVCFTENLYKLAEEREWTNVDDEGVPWDKNFVEWKFKEDAKPGEYGTVDDIKMVFSPGYDKYDVEWKFDPKTDSYKRYNGGQKHLDNESKEHMTAKNVIAQVMKFQGSVDDNAHVLYGTIGSGKAFIFQDGKVIKGTWSKPSRISRTKFFDEKGTEVAFNRGPIWIEAMSDEKNLTY